MRFEIICVGCGVRFEVNRDALRRSPREYRFCPACWAAQADPSRSREDVDAEGDEDAGTHPVHANPPHARLRGQDPER